MPSTGRHVYKFRISMKIDNISIFFRFFRPVQKMGPDGPKWGQEDFFLLIQTLPTFWAQWIWMLIIFSFYLFGPHISGFPGPQISRFPDFQTPPPAPPSISCMVLAAVHKMWNTDIATRAPCDVFDPWVRWERGQVGI